MRTNLLIVGLFSICTASMAFAESYAECIRKGGSEAGLMLAPKAFEVNEAGSVTLSIQDEGGFMTEVLAIEVGNQESFYYGSKAIKLSLSATKNLFSREVRGTEVYSVKACDNEETTAATYTFKYKKGRETVSAGSATYECQCGLD